MNRSIENAAYHEAGHVVVAYKMGWWARWVEIEGIGLGERDYTALIHYEGGDTDFTQVVVNCAGWLAGWKHDNLSEQLRDDESLIYELESIEYDWIEEDEDGGDEYDSLLAIKKNYPDWSDIQVIAKFREYESLCRKFLDAPSTWSQVERIAKALLEKGKVEKEEIESLLDGR